VIFTNLITNAYANEVITRNDFSHYLRTMWPFVKVKLQTL